MKRSICDFVFSKIQVCRTLSVLMISVIGGISACNVDVNPDDGECKPTCGAVSGQCNDDGCGSVCPCLNADEVCDLSGQCVDEDACAGGCEGRQCGSVCGVSCGDCSAGKACEEGICVCSPQCDGIHCGQDDGCGNSCDCGDGQACIDSLCVDGEDPCAAKKCGTWNGQNCGTCEGELLCNAAGQCVTDCDDVCGDVGWQCGGTICHDECGPCESNEVCDNHVCICQPTCSNSFCGDDGCGGRCECSSGEKCGDDSETCVECTDEDTCKDRECGTICGNVCGEHEGECGSGESCVDGYCEPSSLKMTLVSSEYSTSDERIHGTLQIEYVPREGEPRPRMADLRIDTNRTVGLEIDSIVLGVAGTMSQKSLYLDPITLKPWRYRPDGSVQMLIYTGMEDLAASDETIDAGVLVLVNFTCELTDDDPTTGITENAVDLFLVRRNQIFAPFEADLALQETPYDTAVRVTK